MKIYALTGGIASGKSTTLKIFESLGAFCLSADMIAKEITRSPDIIKKIVGHFGDSYGDNEVGLNRKKIRELISQNLEAKYWLENLLHPLIKTEIKTKLDAVHNKYIYAIVEIPLLKNKKNYPYINGIIYIKSNPETQLKRIQKRDNCSETEAKHMLSIQIEPQIHHKIADYVLEDLDNIDKLREQVIKLHQKLQ
jgi:dephospho-CoA kinase